MNRLILSFFLTGTLFWAQSPSVMAQEGGTGLREEIRQAEAEIRRIDQLIGDTRKEQGVTLDELRLVGSKLENRQKIIQNLNSEVSVVSAQVNAKNRRVEELQKQQQELKDRYSALIRIGYKNYRNNSLLSFLFTSQDFSDAARRFYYVKRLGGELQKKSTEIVDLNKTLVREVGELGLRKKSLASLQNEQTAELSKLDSERRQLQKTQTDLKGKEKQLMAEAEQRRQRINALQQELQRLVAEEMKKKAPSGTASAPGGTPVPSSEWTAQFRARQGKLPYPVEGTVVDKFGIHAHPTQKGIKVDNKGINIAASSGAKVQCVFDGEVRKVFFFQGLGNAVMVRHGDYLTIYANLAEVFVREGERVLSGQALGAVAKASAGQQSTLHFELWKESENMDPERWIAK